MLLFLFYIWGVWGVEIRIIFSKDDKNLNKVYFLKVELYICKVKICWY